MDELSLSVAIENRLVALNPRGMADVQSALEPGYYLRAAQILKDVQGHGSYRHGVPRERHLRNRRASWRDQSICGA